MTFQYNREADILYINTCEPYPEQESEELLEVLFFSTRLLQEELFQLPIAARSQLSES